MKGFQQIVTTGDTTYKRYMSVDMAMYAIFRVHKMKADSFLLLIRETLKDMYFPGMAYNCILQYMR